MRVSIIGAGYVGLVTGACLAEKDHTVYCVEKDLEKVGIIAKGISPIFEHGLSDLLTAHIHKKFYVTSNLYRSVQDTEITLIAVGTPFDGKQIDLRHVRGAAEQIGTALKDKSGYHVVIVKSTVVPGTTDEVVIPILESASKKKVGNEVGVGTNPEFLTEGQAIADFMNPDRIVLGAHDEKTMNLMELMYDSFNGVPIVKTNNKSAEMIKYVSNAMLATQISFANEMASLCSAIGGIDIVDVMKGVHLSSYLSLKVGDGRRIQAPLSSFLEAGCGFGGSCLPKDVKALIAHGEKKDLPMDLLKAVMERNRLQPSEVIKLLRKHFASLKGIRITILGLAFKPDTDDMRESPAIPIIRELLAQKALLNGYDPAAHREARKIFSPQELSLSENLEDAVARVDAVVLVTSWRQFKEVPKLLAKVNRHAILVDGRRMLDKYSLSKYEGIGV